MSYVSAMPSLDGHSESGKVANMIVNKLTDSDRIHVIFVPELLIRIDTSKNTLLWRTSCPFSTMSQNCKYHPLPLQFKIQKLDSGGSPG